MPPDVPTCSICLTANSRKKVIQCDGQHSCGSYFHRSCVGVTRAQAEALSVWSCSSCAPTTQRPTTTTRQTIGSFNEDTFSECFPRILAHLRKTKRVVRHIPRGARANAASVLNTLINDALHANTPQAWGKFLLFPYLALSVPRSCDTDTSSLATKLRRAINEYASTDLTSLPEVTEDQQDDRGRRTERGRLTERGRQTEDSSATPAERAAALTRRINDKLSDLDIRGALNLLTSSDSIAETSPANLDILIQKHPPVPDDVELPEAPDQQTGFHCDTVAITDALASFLPGSAAGLDGLRPGVLRELTSFSAREAGVTLVASLTRLTNHLLAGTSPEFVRRTLFGATLTALNKKTGGLRPIAVGCLYRRLATKTALRPISSDLGGSLAPVQLGFGVAGGCEAAAHASRWYYKKLEPTDVMIQIDMANAFNTLRRDKFLEVIRDRAPSLYPILWHAYSNTTPLFFGPHELESSTGIQQGDPAGPAIFALTLDQVSRGLQTEFNVWYLDDGCLGGPLDSVLASLSGLRPALLDIGLELNPAKCAIILPRGLQDDEETVSRIQQLLPGAAVARAEETSSLGSPLSVEAIAPALFKKYTDFETMVERLPDLEPHAAFFLLSKCLGIPKLQYLLRTSNTHKFAVAGLRRFDELMRETVSEILNVKFSEAGWTQACLPVGMGGLGIRRSEDVALPCFLASTNSTQALVKLLIPQRHHGHYEAFIASSLLEWRSCFPDVTFPNERGSQRVWDVALSSHKCAEMLRTADQFERARLLAAAAPRSGAWLHAVPAKSLGLLLDRETLRTAVSYRVGSDMFTSPMQMRWYCRP